LRKSIATCRRSIRCSRESGIKRQDDSAYLDCAHAINQIRDGNLRADAAGTFQALAGLWQIFSRQGSLSPAEADQTLAGVMTPFAKIQSDAELFDGGMAGVRLLLKATHSPAKVSAQDRFIDLLAGDFAASKADSARPILGYAHAYERGGDSAF